MPTESTRPSDPSSLAWTANAYAMDRDPLFAASGMVQFEVGLNVDAVRDRRHRFGDNALAPGASVPLWIKLAAQFKDLVIWILIGAAILSGMMGEWSDAAAILAIIIVNGIIGFVQEERAEQALSALQKLSSPNAKVIRDGELQLIPAVELVPGDRIELESGDNVPADARLITAFGLNVQEASLTGESTPVTKEACGALPIATPLADRRNMVYSGTVVSAGKGHAMVVAIGMNTELGQIASLLQRDVPEPTPLQRRLAELGRVLVILCVGIAALVFMLHLARGGALLEVLLVSVSLAVAAVPEGLPAVVTLTLAMGLQRMVRRNALVRKLPSVETLGSVTVICTDKTGTLTRNEMTVREIVVGETRYHVSGGGYVPHGSFFAITDGIHPQGVAIDPRNDSDLVQLLTTGLRCNNAAIRPRGDGIDGWEVIGDPTEGALIVVAMKSGLDTAPQSISLEIPFDSERKAMSIVVRDSTSRLTMYTKGAPEAILAKCTFERRQGRIVPLTEERRDQIMAINSEMGSRALRVLAFAYRESIETNLASLQESELIFAGLTGMIDPPRDEVRDAVRRCRAAGISPVMITGDHPETALAIARELNIADASLRAVTGMELNHMSDESLRSLVAHTAVFARVSAQHKLRIVRAWKERGEIVAMTGDGVNDAPAVKAADIGIAMGMTGTDVTKEASDMVLTDDNFASIVNAIEEGRGIFDNIQKFVNYLLSCNVGEVLLMLMAAILGWPVPLIAIQILWINLVTDGLPALALGMEPPEPDIMDRAPRPTTEPVITRRRGSLYLAQGIMIASVGLLGFWIVYGGNEEHLARARTVTFCITAFTQLFFAMGCRSQRLTMPELGFFSNPHLVAAILISGLLQLSVVTLPFAQPVFEAATHLSWEWLLILILSLAPVSFIELTKLALAWLRNRGWIQRTQLGHSVLNGPNDCNHRS